MNWPALVRGVFGILMLAVPCTSSEGQPKHPYRHSIVDVPVSIATGTVRTPDSFSAPAGWYWIMLQFEKPLPFRDMQCLVGVKDGTDDFKDCAREPVVDANWALLSDGQVVDKGSSSGFGAAKFTKDYIVKFLGKFSALPEKKYVLEVKFTRDGTALNVANPHLIVVKVGLE